MREIIGNTTATPNPRPDQNYDPTSTNAQSGKAVAQAIANVVVNGSVGLTREIVNELPNITDVSETVIYMILRNIPDESNIYDEYMFIGGEWELIGSTAVDLTGYATTQEVASMIDDATKNPILDYITYTITENNTVTLTGCDTSISGSHIIPDTIEGYPVTTIGDNAFKSCYNLTNITIPNSITSIGDYAFTNAPIRNIIIPDSVTSIGSYAFYECFRITSMNIPNSVVSIGENAFGYCSDLIHLRLPNNLTDITPSMVFCCIDLATVDMPNNTTHIGDNAFGYSWNLTHITIPNSVVSIGDRAFSECPALTDVYFMGSEEEWNKISIGSENEALLNATIHYDQALATQEYVNKKITPILDYIQYEITEEKTITITGCDKSISGSHTIPNNIEGYPVTVIGDFAFGECESLTSIIIPDSVTGIGTCAFYCCYRLTDVNIPDSVTYMGPGVFSGCLNLTSITLPASIIEMYDGIFSESDALTDIYYMGSAEQWESLVDGLDLVGGNENVTIHYNQAFATKEYVNEKLANITPGGSNDYVTREELGDIEAALDRIIELQNTLIGGVE